MQERNLNMSNIQDDINLLDKSLWVDKYSPNSFRDLLSDGVCIFLILAEKLTDCRKLIANFCNG
jgi:hypothetical protein